MRRAPPVNHQCWYDMTLAVHPLDPDRLYLGAIILQASIDGGHTFREIHPNNLYVDQHLLVFDTLSGPDVLYLANDGGVYRSQDAGTSWISLATNLALAQYYPGITAHPSDPAVALGGTQDHGTRAVRGRNDHMDQGAWRRRWIHGDRRRGSRHLVRRDAMGIGATAGRKDPASGGCPGSTWVKTPLSSPRL